MQNREKFRKNYNINYILCKISKFFLSNFIMIFSNLTLRAR